MFFINLMSHQSVDLPIGRLWPNGLQSKMRIVYRLFSVRVMWPAHCRFSDLTLWMRSVIPVHFWTFVQLLEIFVMNYWNFVTTMYFNCNCVVNTIMAYLSVLCHKIRQPLNRLKQLERLDRFAAVCCPYVCYQNKKKFK